MKHFIIIIGLLLFIIFSTVSLHAYLNEKPKERNWINLFYTMCFFVCLEIILFYIGVDSFIGGVG